MDVLDHLDKINICTAYEYEGKKITDFPTDISRLEKCRPVYEELPGWKTDLSKVKKHKDLPDNAKKYLDKLSEIAEAPIYLVSTGPERDQTLLA